ncbi:hypothetical protein P9139_07405 [Curtobacterium flaccumfaciens]|nr:hypothetical protein P9139_07405 [Curtobacterium flaccumfaciens]
MRILFVCSGNICRSPLGAQVLTARLGPDASAFTVESAGTIAQDGARWTARRPRSRCGSAGPRRRTGPGT